MHEGADRGDLGDMPGGVKQPLASLIMCRAALSWFGHFGSMIPATRREHIHLWRLKITVDLHEWQDVATRYRRRQEAYDTWWRWLLG